MRNNDRYALLIGASTYDSEHYHDLPAVRADLHYMQAVLQSTEIGQYNDCAMVPDPTRAEMLHAIESFLGERQQSESALLYFSGHGEFCEADNQLYFLTRDSDPADLPRTAVSAEFLERTLQSCRAVQDRTAGLLRKRFRRPGLACQGPGEFGIGRGGAQHPVAPHWRLLHHRLGRAAGRLRHGSRRIDARYFAVHG